MQRASIIVVGSVNVDLVIRVPHLPRPGETVLGGEFFKAAGGKGANQAVAAARLSAEPVAFIAAVGDDAFGRQSLDDLRQENLLLRIKVVPGMASGVAQIVVDARGENAIAVASGANTALTANDVAGASQELFPGARVLLACLETPLDTVLDALQRAKRAGLCTILNPAPAAALKERLDVLEWVDVLTPNQLEAAELAGGDARMEPLAAAQCLRQWAAKSCIITLGAAGCLVASDSTEHIAGMSVQAVDTTAAGDAFNGALAVALAEGRSLLDAARFANGAAAIAVTRRGAQPSLPTRDELEDGGTRGIP